MFVVVTRGKRGAADGRQKENRRNQKLQTTHDRSPSGPSPASIGQNVWDLLLFQKFKLDVLGARYAPLNSVGHDGSQDGPPRLYLKSRRIERFCGLHNVDSGKARPFPVADALPGVAAAQRAGAAQGRHEESGIPALRAE